MSISEQTNVSVKEVIPFYGPNQRVFCIFPTRLVSPHIKIKTNKTKKICKEQEDREKKTLVSMNRHGQPTEQMYLGTICKVMRSHVLFLCSYLQVPYSCDFLQYSVSIIIFGGFFTELCKMQKKNM